MARLDRRAWAYLARASQLLLSARLRHARGAMREILDDLQSPPAPAPQRHGFDPLLAGWAIRTAARYAPWRSDCLIQAIAAARWLRRMGFAPEFHLGVARSDAGAIRGHAWLTLDGGTIVGAEDDDSSFAQLRPPAGEALPDVHERS